MCICRHTKTKKRFLFSLGTVDVFVGEEPVTKVVVSVVGVVVEGYTDG